MSPIEHKGGINSTTLQGKRCTLAISFVGKVYAKVPMGHVVEPTKRKKSEKQCGFRKHRNCSDQVFVARRL